MSRRHVVHKIKSPFKSIAVGSVDTRTVCGLNGYTADFDDRAYTLHNADGGVFHAATSKSYVTCQKCLNLLNIGTLHDRSSRTADAAQ